MNEKYRHEIKLIVDKNAANVLKYRLSLVMSIDQNSYNEDNSYFIRSLYFDDIYNTSFYEKEAGISIRERYRIRFYNFNKKYLRLEKKQKNNNLINKKQSIISLDIFNNIINKNFNNINVKKDSLLNEFILKCKYNDLRPSVIVDYKRVAFTYPIEDIRITFDENIKSSRYNTDIFNKNLFMHDVLENNEVILEIKYNEFIPRFIIDVVNTIPSINLSFSKFALCTELKEV